MMERITRLSNASFNWSDFLLPNSSFLLSELHQAERGKCRLIDCRCNRQTVVSLESCDGFSGHRPKDPIDRSVVVTSAGQLLLDVDSYLIRRQPIVSVN